MIARAFRATVVGVAAFIVCAAMTATGIIAALAVGRILTDVLAFLGLHFAWWLGGAAVFVCFAAYAIASERRGY